MQTNNQQQQLSTLRLKYLIRRLETANIVGGAVTMMIPSKKQIHQIISSLNSEINEAANIKNKQHKNSVIEAQSAIKERLKTYKKVPENGLIVFSGTVLDQYTKGEKRLLEVIEPPKPVHSSLYSCDKRFHLSSLYSLISTSPTFGYIILDGQGVLFATLSGSSYKILYQNSVTLPNKHCRGGQSKLRFQRLALEARHVYLGKVCELVRKYFVENEKCGVIGIVLAGSAGLKNQLMKSGILDKEVAGKVSAVVDVAQGGVEGLHQAIGLTKGVIRNSKLEKDREVLDKFFDNINQDTGLVVSGIKGTFQMLENRMLKKLVISENLTIKRVEIISRQGSHLTQFLKQNQPLKLEKGDSLHSTQLLSEWLIENIAQYNCQLVFVGDQLEGGVRFVGGYGGVAGYLRHKVEYLGEEEWEDTDDETVLERQESQRSQRRVEGQKEKVEIIEIENFQKQQDMNQEIF